MRIVIITNILSPYRRFFFDELNKYLEKIDVQFNVILMADTERGRSWKYEDLKTDYTIKLPNKTLYIKDDIFIHINCGLEEKLKSLKPDIVIVGGGYLFPSVWNTIRLQKKLKYKLLFWSESHLNSEKGYSSFKVRVREKIRQVLYNSFDGFLYSGDMSKKLIDFYCNKDKEMYLVPNLVDEEQFKKADFIRETSKKSLRERYNIDFDRYIFICPARLEKVKGIEEFISIYQNISRECLDKATLLICGDGELRESISRLIESINNVDIRLLGNKSQQELIELYSLSDCFLLPSLSDANPLTCIESLWSGLPLLVSEHVGNHPEVVSEGENGYVFNYKDTLNAKEKIEKLIRSDDNWKKAARNKSKEIALERFESRKIIEILSDMLIENYNEENYK